MTQKEIILINALNRSGLDNSMWGVNSKNSDSKVLYGTEEYVELPPHIFVYRTFDYIPAIDMSVMRPDMTLVDDYRSYIDIYFIDIQ